MQHMHNLLENTVDVVDIEPPAELRYRAATVDQAVAQATSELGQDVEVLEASRIRRGGVGGFFATDLGVEVVVTPTSPVRASRNVRDAYSSGASESAQKPYNQSEDMVDDSMPHVEHTTAVDETVAAPTGAAAATIDVASFARHFAREMALETADPAATSTPTSRSEAAPTAQPQPEAQPKLEAQPKPDPKPDPQPDVTFEAVPAATPRPAPTPVSAEPKPEPQAAPRLGTPSPSLAPAPAPAPTVSTAVESVSDAAPATKKPARKPRAPRDPLRRPTELVAGAIDSLVFRLSETSPVDGSRLKDLRRVTVRLTTSDGTVIEMAAELGEC